MIVTEKRQIIEELLRQGKPKKTLCRELGVSLSYVRRVSILLEVEDLKVDSCLVLIAARAARRLYRKSIYRSPKLTNDLS